MSKAQSILDYPNNMYESAFDNILSELLKSSAEEGGGGGGQLWNTLYIDVVLTRGKRCSGSLTYNRG